MESIVTIVQLYIGQVLIYKYIYQLIEKVPFAIVMIKISIAHHINILNKLYYNFILF